MNFDQAVAVRKNNLHSNRHAAGDTIRTACPLQSVSIARNTSGCDGYGHVVCGIVWGVTP